MSPIRMTLNFYPRPPRGGRPGCGGELAVNVNISIHALREEGDDCGTQGLRWIAISIHALREEGDGRRYFMGLFNFLFLSTPSARRATFPTSKPTRKQSYFYPRPPRGGRPTPSKTGRRGGDFYPRPPRGGRPLKDDGLVAIKKFLSTPSARRATQCGQLRHQLLQDFYPRPPRGGRRLAKIIGHALNAISIHALREEGDGLLYDYYTLADLFLSTPSARRAT